MSLFGDDGPECGTRQRPCGTLRRAIRTANHITLLKNQSENGSFQHCAEEPITKSLTIEALEPGLATLKCPGNHFLGLKTSLLFHLENVTVVVKNIVVVDSHILVSNGDVQIRNCTFDNSALFLMQREFYSYFLDSTPLNKWSIVVRLDQGYMYWMADAEARENSVDILTCFHTSLTIVESTWLPQGNQIPYALDIPHPLGIQSICQSINITIAESKMADNPVAAFAVENLGIFLSETSFVGTSHGSVIQGGLKATSFCFPIISVENCIFKDLKYSDIVFSHVAALQSVPAAFSIILHEFSRFGFSNFGAGINLKPLGRHHVYVSNTTFQSNFRGFGIKSHFPGNHVLKVQVTDSIFNENQVVSDGGGIYTSGNVSMEIQRSRFVSNMAGVNAFNLGLTLPGVAPMNIPYDSPKAYGYAFLSPTSLRLDLEYYVTIDASFVNESILLGLRGSGGAIAMEKTVARITSCAFVNNTASSTGGALYSGKEAWLSLLDSAFTSGDMNPSLTSGIIIQSQAEMRVKDTYFNVLVASQQPVPAFHHSVESVATSLRMNNLSMACPTHAQFKVVNITNDIKERGAQLTARPSRDVALNDLILTCTLCPEGYYAFEAGYFAHTSEVVKGRSVRAAGNGTSAAVTLATVFAPPPPPAPPFAPPPPPPPPPPPLNPATNQIHHHFTHVDVTCQVCPYGGVCHGGIKSKANYWGTLRQGTVTFHRCPPGYCCSKTLCDQYNSCTKHRQGTLCSTCRDGYSEALFSTTCLPSSQCNQTWFIPFVVVLVSLYAAFLMHQNNLKDFLLAPIGRKTLKQTVVKWTKRIDAGDENEAAAGNAASGMAVSGQSRDTCRPIPQSQDAQSKDEGGIFLILLFYYFQDAAIVHFDPIYAKATDPIITLVKRFLGGLFRFQLDVLLFAGSICPFPGLNPVQKVWLKLLFIPSLFTVLLSIYGFSKAMLCRGERTREKWRVVAAKTSMALMFATLFSYQRLAASAFGFVYCVSVAGHSVLFLDGSVKCLETWQILMVVYIFLCVVPFGLYIALVPALLIRNQISVMQFFVGCFLPLPMMLVIMFQSMMRKRHESNMAAEQNLEAKHVYNILQGPYKEYILSFSCSQKVSLCWSGVLLIRRLLLIITFTYVPNIMLRLLIMSLISFGALLHHVTVRPCKENRANVAGTVSCAALLCVAVINLIRATFEVAEYIPEFGIKAIMDSLELVEDCLLFWIPLVGASVMILFLLTRIVSALINRKWKH